MKKILILFLVGLFFPVILFARDGTPDDFTSGSITEDLLFHDDSYELINNLDITDSGKLTFNAYDLTVDEGMIVTSEDKSVPIVFENGSELDTEGDINATVDLEDSTLNSLGANISNLNITGDSVVSAQDTQMINLNIIYSALNSDDFDFAYLDGSITSVTISDDGSIPPPPPSDGCSDTEPDCNVDYIRFKGTVIEDVNINITDNPEYLDISFDSTTITNFTVNGSAVGLKYVNVEDSVINLIDANITNFNIDYGDLTIMTFDGGTIENFNINNVTTADSLKDCPDGGTDCEALPDTNFQLQGSGVLVIENFNLNNSPVINIEGDTDDSEQNMSVSNIEIHNMTNYSNTVFSFYDVGSVVFGVAPEDGDDSDTLDIETDPIKIAANTGTDESSHYNTKVSSFTFYYQDIDFIDTTTGETASSVTFDNVNYFEVNNSYLENNNVVFINSDFTYLNIINAQVGADGSSCSFEGGTSSGGCFDLQSGGEVYIKNTHSDLNFHLSGQKNIVKYDGGNTGNKVKIDFDQSGYCPHEHIITVEGEKSCDINDTEGNPLVVLDYDYWSADDATKIEDNILYIYKGDDIIIEQLDDTEVADSDIEVAFTADMANKISVADTKVTFAEVIDNLTTLEVIGEGDLDFSDLSQEDLDSTIIADDLRMRGGYLTLDSNIITVNDFDAYIYGTSGAGTFRLSINDEGTSGEVIVNDTADFHNNYLTVDIYWDPNKEGEIGFLELDETVTIDIMHAGSIVNLKGVNFDEGIMFDISYTVTDTDITATITRVHDFSYYISGEDLQTAKIFDDIVNTYADPDDVNKKDPYIYNPDLSDATIVIINGLFDAQTAEDLQDDFVSLRPINNEVFHQILNTSLSDLNALLLDSNYLMYNDNGIVGLWAKGGLTKSNIKDTEDVIGVDQNGYNYMFGVDVTPLSWLKLSAFANYGNSSYSNIFYDGDMRADSYGAILEFSLPKNLFVKLFGYSTNARFSGSRYQDFIDSSSSYQTKEHEQNYDVSLGYNFVFKGFNFTTSASVGYVFAKLDDYQESQSYYDYASLKVYGFNTNYMDSSIALGFNKKVNINSFSYLTPKIGLIYSYNNYDIPDTVAEFSNVTTVEPDEKMVYSAANYDKNSLQINIGLEYSYKDKSIIGIYMNNEVLNKDMANYVFSLSYKYII